MSSGVPVDPRKREIAPSEQHRDSRDNLETKRPRDSSLSSSRHNNSSRHRSDDRDSHSRSSKRRRSRSPSSRRERSPSSRRERSPSSRRERSPSSRRDRSPYTKEKAEEDLSTLEILRYRNKKYKFFDIPANGFDSISPDQYLMMEESGQIPHLIYIPSSSLSINRAIPGSGCFVNTQAKRLYVGNIPLTADEGEIVDFFNQMLEINCLRVGEPGPVVTSAQMNLDKNFAFIELRSVDETSNCMTLDGVEFHGCALKIKRPRDYQPIQTWSISGDYESLPVNLQLRSLASANPNDGKVIISNLPKSTSDSDARSLVQIYGEIRYFELTADKSTGKGSVFVEYANPSSADEAVRNLDGSMVDGCKLNATLAYKVNAAATAPVLPGVASINVPGVDLKKSAANPTNVLCMRNMVEPDELVDDEEYEDIIIDIRTECDNFGTVMSIEIPRPQPGVSEVPGLGKVFVEYSTVEECKRAFENLSGRKFSDRIVVVSFFDPENYQNRQFNI